MTKISKRELFESFKESGQHICPLCIRDFSCVDSLAEHIQIDHQVELEDMNEELNQMTLEPKNKQVLDSWEEEQKLEILKEAYEKEPEQFGLYQKDPKSLDLAVRRKLFKEALSLAGRGMSTLDAMFMRAMPLAQEGRCPEGTCRVDFGGEIRCVPMDAYNKYMEYKAEPYDYKGAHKPDPTSGQSDVTIEMPRSPEAEKVLERSSKMEELSQDKRRKELLLILTALVRRRSN